MKDLDTRYLMKEALIVEQCLITACLSILNCYDFAEMSSDSSGAGLSGRTSQDLQLLKTFDDSIKDICEEILSDESYR